MPNSTASSTAPDFVTALGRLLQSGPLRDAFAANPRAVADEMGLRTRDRAAFLQLVPDELEAQAVVLLRKRFDLVRRALPCTCAGLGEQAWPKFRRYARGQWPQAEAAVAHDARGFCAHLADAPGETVCALERNRLEFLTGKRRIVLRPVRAAYLVGKSRAAVQILWRARSARWREWVLYFRL